MNKLFITLIAISVFSSSAIAAPKLTKVLSKFLDTKVTKEFFSSYSSTNCTLEISLYDNEEYLDLTTNVNDQSAPKNLESWSRNHLGAGNKLVGFERNSKDQLLLRFSDVVQKSKKNIYEVVLHKQSTKNGMALDHVEIRFYDNGETRALPDVLRCIEPMLRVR